MVRQSAPNSRWLANFGILALSLFASLIISGFFAPDGITQTRDSLTIILDHAGTLRQGNKVCFRGVPVGSVEKLHLAISDDSNIAKAQSSKQGQENNEIPQIKAICSLQKGVRNFITVDSTIELATDSVNNTFIDIQPGSGALIPPTGSIRLSHDENLAPAEEYQRTVKSLRKTAETLNEILELLIAEDGLNQTLRTLGDAGHSVRDTAEEFRILIRDGRSPVLSSIQQAEDILIELRAHSQSIPEVMDSISRAGMRAESMMNTADKLLHENRGPFRETIENLQYTSENLHALAAELRRRPWRILNAPGDREGAFIALHECANRYADGALEVRRATEQVRDLLNRRGEDTEILDKLESALHILGDRLSRQAELEKTLLERTQDLATPR